MSFWAYMLHCRGGKFYVGHSDNLERRIEEHQSGLCGGFTADRLPVELVWSQEFVARYEALTAERQVKGWGRAKKLALIRGDWDRISILAKSKTTLPSVRAELVEALSFSSSGGENKDSPSTSSGRTGGEQGHFADG